MNAALLAAPGGTQTAWNEVSWDDGAVVLTVAAGGPVTAAAIAGSDCASGKFCIYSLQNYKGNKVTFSTCTSSHSVAGLGASVHSVANARNSGNVKALNGAAVVATVPAGTGTNIIAAVTSLSCS